MKNIIVIPARYQSTRLPGKPLVLINGHSLLYRVWSLAKNAKNIDEKNISVAFSVTLSPQQTTKKNKYRTPQITPKIQADVSCFLFIVIIPRY